MTTVRESLVLGGIELNDFTSDFVLIDGTLSLAPPAKRPEWAQSADADGAALVRDPLSDNRTVSFDLRVNRIVTTPAATMDDVLGLVAQISGKLEEAEKQPDGLALVWTPANSANSVTFDVLTGSIDEIPVTVTGDGKGWFRKYPRFKVSLTCKPFGRLPEVTGPSVTTSNPIAVLTVPSVAGEVPALGRLVVTDAASQSRRHLEWGIENRYENGATSLELDSASLATSGFAGTSTTRAGSHNTNVVHGALLAQPIAVAGTGNLGHVGTFRVKARVYATSETAMTRLTWQDGDGPFRANGWAAPPVTNDWAEVDLGTVTITPAQAGTQKWSGRLEAVDTAVGTIDFDYLLLIPTESYGKARAPFAEQPGVTVAADDFESLADTVALNGRVAPLGGTWATSGATGDFTKTTDAGVGVVWRLDVSGSPRYAILGSTAHTDVEVSVDVRSTIPATPVQQQMVVARWTDANNHLSGILIPSWAVGATYGTHLQIQRTVGGVQTILAESTFMPARPFNQPATLRLIVYSYGQAILTAHDSNGSLIGTVIASSSSLATGGTLDSGLAGFADIGAGSPGSSGRYYDNAAIAIPAAENLVLHSAQSAEIRHDSAIREDATGTYYGNMPAYRGDRFRLQPAGDAGRTSRILVKARRNDTDTAADSSIADSTTVQVFYVPRILTVPHT